MFHGQGPAAPRSVFKIVTLREELRFLGKSASAGTIKPTDPSSPCRMCHGMGTIPDGNCIACCFECSGTGRHCRRLCWIDDQYEARRIRADRR